MTWAKKLEHAGEAGRGGREGGGLGRREGVQERWCLSPHPPTLNPEREFFIDNLLVRIHFIIEMSLVDRRCAMGVCIPSCR